MIRRNTIFFAGRKTTQIYKCYGIQSYMKVPQNIQLTKNQKQNCIEIIENWITDKVYWPRVVLGQLWGQINSKTQIYAIKVYCADVKAEVFNKIIAPSMYSGWCENNSIHPI